MPPVSFSQWYQGSQYPGGSTGGPAVPTPFFRDTLDARRSMFYRTPDAEYPDGYLGTISSNRHDDRLLNAVQSRLTEKQYQRGVHKGERIDMGDYFWQVPLDPMAGIRRQSETTQRFAPVGEPLTILVAEGKGLPRGAEGVISMDPHRRAQLASLQPGWR